MNNLALDMKQVQIKTPDQAFAMCEKLAKSAVVPSAYRGKPADLFVAMQMASELGLPPLNSLANIAVINGKPSLYGDAMIAVARAHPLCQKIEETYDSTTMTATCTVYRIKRAVDNIAAVVEKVQASFGKGDAVAAGLWGRQGPWKSYPKRMLQMRARGFALRDAFPDALRGVIIYEEAKDLPIQHAVEDIDPSPPAPALESNPEETPQETPQEKTNEADVFDEAVSSEYEYIGINKNVKFDDHQKYFEHILGVQSLIDSDIKTGLAQRRTNLKEMIVRNQDGISRLPNDWQEQIKSSHNKRIRKLSAEIRKAENND